MLRVESLLEVLDHTPIPIGTLQRGQACPKGAYQEGAYGYGGVIQHYKQ